MAEAIGATRIMKRSQRRSHFATWLVLAPLLFVLIKLAVSERPDAPVNDALPAVLLEEAG